MSAGSLELVPYLEGEVHVGQSLDNQLVVLKSKALWENTPYFSHGFAHQLSCLCLHEMEKWRRNVCHSCSCQQDQNIRHARVS